MKKQLGFIVDSERCIGCNSCEMACKSYYQLEPKIRWRKVYQLKEDEYGSPTRMYMSLACNHCADPQCLKACPVRAYSKREDGIVIHNQKRCIGCGMCIMACPYNVPEINDKVKKVEKCHLCYKRIDKGEGPICVEGCPVDALSIVDLNSFNDFGTVEKLVGFPNPEISKPAVRFIRPKAVVQVRPASNSQEEKLKNFKN